MIRDGLILPVPDSERGFSVTRKLSSGQSVILAPDLAIEFFGKSRGGDRGVRKVLSLIYPSDLEGYEEFGGFVMPLRVDSQTEGVDIVRHMLPTNRRILHIGPYDIFADSFLGRFQVHGVSLDVKAPHPLVPSDPLNGKSPEQLRQAMIATRPQP